MHIADDFDKLLRMWKKELMIYFKKVLDLIPGAKGSQVPATYERFAEVAKEFEGTFKYRCSQSIRSRPSIRSSKCDNSSRKG